MKTRIGEIVVTFSCFLMVWNDGFDFPDSFYSVSDIQDYIEYVILNI